MVTMQESIGHLLESKRVAEGVAKAVMANYT